MRLVLRVVLVGALVVGAALPAQAQTVFVPVTPNVQTYFHCSSSQTSKVGNLEGPATWNETAPTASVTSAAGCGQASVAPGPVSVSFTGGGARVNEAQFTGTYTGNLDQLTVRLDAIYAGEARSGSAAPLRVKLTIDGVEVLGATGQTVSVTPVPSATRASEAFTFSINRIGLLAEKDNKAHTITLAVHSAAMPAQAWVYDTTEVPGGIDFAPASLAAAVITR